MLYFAFKGQDFSRLTSQLKSANFYWVAVAAIVTMVAHLVRAIRWNMLIEPMGYHPKNSNTFIAVLIGYLANLAFPRLGEVTRCGTLTKTDNIPMDKLIGTVIVERVVDLLSLIIILVLTVLLQFNRISTFVYDHLLKGIIEKLSANTTAMVISIILVVVGITGTLYVFKKNKDRIYQSGLGKKLWVYLKVFLMV